MIYTLTFSPSLDYYIDCDSIDSVTRATSARYELGGKGLNVSRVLKTFGMKSKAIILTGGFVGAEILRLCEELEINTINIPTQANSRINVKLPGVEINAPVPLLAEDEIAALTAVIDSIEDGALLVVSGRVPENIDIKAMFGGRNFQLICDVSGQALHDFMEINPAIIKPNTDELAEYFGLESLTTNEIIACAKELTRDDDTGKDGPMFTVVSMGENGVLVCVGQNIYAIYPHKGEVLNTVAAGDACLAGFIAGMMGNVGLEGAIRYANAAGAATAFSVGLPTADLIQELFLNEDIMPFGVKDK
ncbi:MAG: PfkB family carbohydrate kinase [Ruminococcus sp.]|jgi:1-phosphofructokinase|nr:PfkB family carbohydrate kinase [Ruminococcus sp.]